VSEWDFILKNKPVVIKTAVLTLTMSLGYMQAGTIWHTQEQYNQLPDVAPIPWDNIQITIKLDQQLIFESTINNLTQVTHVFEDSADIRHHALTIHINGINDQHRPRWPGDQSGGAMLKIHSITIEDMDMRWVMPELGNYILEDGSINIATELAGSNGIQTLPFTTPIYSWLIEHHKLILHR
jgi:hypothetical protein